MPHKFIESICFKNGIYHGLALHQQRVNKTFSHFYQSLEPMNLESILPKIDSDERQKVRILYDGENQNIEFIRYEKKVIQTLEVVSTKAFDYSFKYEDRDRINKLKVASKADDIIISFSGEIKDSSYANLAFWDGSEWLTPERPLLEGVKRAQLLAEGKIKKAPLHISDLGAFKKVSLINAMLDLGEMEIDISSLTTPKNAF